MYITCANCGHHNERVRDCCTHCSRRLHRSALERLVKRSRRSSGKITGLQITIVCAGIVLALLCIILLSVIDIPDLF